MSYETIKIEDICTKVTSGGTPKSTNNNFYYPKEIPWLKTGEVNYCRIYDTDNYISKEGLTRSSAKLIPENSVIIAMYGQGDTAGRVAINKIPLCTNQACCNLIVNHEIADYEYVYYALSTMYEKFVSLKNGGAQPNLNAGIIKNVEIPFPELNIQKRISSILSTYDKLIENNQKQIKLLEEAAQRLYKEWFVDLRFPGYEDVEIVDGVPEGWNKGILSDICMESGKKERKENRTSYSYYLPIDCMPKKSLSYIEVKDIELAESSLVSFDKDDILFGAMRPYFHKVVVARDSGLTRSTCFVLNAISSDLWSYTAMLLFAKDTIEFATKISVGTTMPYVRWKDMKNMEIIIPSSELAKEFDKYIHPMIQKISALSEQIILLQEARDRLLPKLMSDELEV